MEDSEKRQRELWAQFVSSEGEERVKVLMELGHDAFHEGRHIESLAMSETAKQIYESMGAAASSTALAFVYRSIGWSLKQLRRYPEAVVAARRSAEIYRELGDVELLEALNEEGDYWFEQEQWEQALGAYEASLHETHPDRSKDLLAQSYGNCGFALGKLDRNEESIEHHLQARAIAKALKDPWQVAFFDEELAFRYYKIKNVEKALFYGEKALDFAIITDHPERMKWANARMALIKKLEGEFDEGLAFAEKAKVYSMRQKSTHWSFLIGIEQIMADLYEGKGDLQEATERRRRLKTLEETVKQDQDL